MSNRGAKYATNNTYNIQNMARVCNVGTTEQSFISGLKTQPISSECGKLLFSKISGPTGGQNLVKLGNLDFESKKQQTKWNKLLKVYDAND